MDRILFGDNQFFGINHMSEEKARQQAMTFREVGAIVETLRAAHDAGIAAPEAWQGMKFYPCMPYAHKYANAVTELGYVDALRKFMPSGNLVDSAMRGGKVLLTRDVKSAATLLIDAEMKAFEGLETPIVFLQNIVTDLLLGLGFPEAFRIFADHVENRYGVEAGFITMNLPALLPALESVGIRNPIVCANVNKIGFRMSGGIQAYRDAIALRPARVIAMSVLASGAIPAAEAIEWVVNEPYVWSILFGASSERNIRNTVELIRHFDSERAMA